MKSWNILNKDTLEIVYRCGTRKSVRKYVFSHLGTIAEPAMERKQRPRNESVVSKHIRLSHEYLMQEGYI